MRVGQSGLEWQLGGKLRAGLQLLQVGGPGGGWWAEALGSGEGDVIGGCCSGSGADKHWSVCCIILTACMVQQIVYFNQALAF